MTKLFSLRRLAVALTLTFAMAACVPKSQPPAPRPSVQRPTPVATARPALPAPAANVSWVDWPITPGDWMYRQDARGSIALFGAVGGDALVTLRCDRSASAIYLSRASGTTQPKQMTLRASTTAQSYPARPTGGSPPYQAVSFSARDPMLDALAFSRGRFLVELEGEQALPLPAWPEVARVLEDCR